ncbi:MAG TPA: hypothetical protein DCW74_00150 [Alteromonas australica]|uniref:Uncharacterized protein n=1 Tax=Alteromonas australica TaxID=589873 RepID=A0A350NYL1_9ALTE|nr:hypothetical protein [Alteromonas australica]|tara:strand:- start:1347 stop:2018 length:672 start_codon:yes stop_codon:yes gene_type:complete
MATTKVVDVLDRASIILQDTGNVRYANADLLKFFNDGQREVVMFRPDANVVHAAFTCAAGSKQSIANITGALRLIEVVRNTSGRSVTQVSRLMLDNSLPNWHSTVADPDIKIEHFIYDSGDPKHFYVYPAGETTFSLDIIYSSSPSDIAITNFSNDTQTISLDDTYANALLDYILYRSYQLDSEFAGNPQRASMHYQAFSAALAQKTQGDAASDPRPVIGGLQ